MHVAAFIDPRRWNPRKGQTGKLFDVILTARPGIGQNCDVGLIGKVEFFQHRTAILATIPDGNEIKMYLRIIFYHFEPAAGFQFSLAIRAPRGPEVNPRLGQATSSSRGPFVRPENLRAEK